MLKEKGSRLSLGFKAWIATLGSTALVASVQIGPGTMTAAITAGSNFGLSLLWLVAMSGIWLAGLTMLAGTVTVVTGKTTIQALDSFIFKGWGTVNGWLQVICNLLATIGVSVGMAEALRVFFPTLSAFAATFILFVISLIFMVLRGKYSFIKSITSVIVAFMFVMFVLNLFFIKLSFSEVLAGLVPQIPEGSAIAIAGIIGGSIGGLPMMFYPYQVKASKFEEKDLPAMRWDNIIFLGVIFAIISVSVVAAASKLEAPASNAIQAAEALAPIGGAAAKWIFSLGFFAVVWTTAVSPCFGTGYYVADLLKFKTKDGTKLLIESDIHTDSRFKILSGITMAGWLIGPLLAKMIPPFVIILMAMGVLNLFVPFIIGSLLYIATKRSIMGEHQIGWFHRIIVIIGFIFSLVGIWSFIDFLTNTLPRVMS